LVLPVYPVDGYIANDFIRHRVLPQCTPTVLGDPRSIIVVDNASFQDMYNIAGVILAYFTTLLTQL
jgi:hypothetical protein